MKSGVRHFGRVAAICGGTALVFLLIAWKRYPVASLDHLEAYTQDLRMTYGEHTPLDTNLVLVGIDRAEYSDTFSDEEIAADPSLKLLLKSFPWSREVWAKVITRLGDAGAKVIVLDLFFGGQGDGDEKFKAALDQYRNRVVIGSNFKDVATDRGNTLVLDEPNPSVLENTNLGNIGFDDRVGYVNIWQDGDGVLRTARYRVEGGKSVDLLPRGTEMESLDARAVRKFGHPELIPPGSDPVRFRYTAPPGLGYRVHSLADILGSKTWKHNYKNGDFFRGKIVMIGPTADIFQDIHKTPFSLRKSGDAEFRSEMLGPEIHLNIIGAALHRKFLRDIPLYQELFILMIAGLTASLLAFLLRHPLGRLLSLVAACTGYWLLAQWFFDHGDWVLPVASPLLVLALSGIFVLGYDYVVEQLERTRVRQTLERYVSKNIVKDLLDNPNTNLRKEGVRRPVTVLFSDVRGFTTMTENSDSALLVKQLNEYLEAMVQQAFKFEGTLDKFIGDAVMVVWGNITTKGEAADAQLAVATALAMKQSLAKLNADWTSRGLPALAIGIGINHGEAICGEMGSAQKMEITVIGDAVNTASRLEGLTKAVHQDLLIGESMAALVGERFVLRTVGLIQPKGKNKPVEVFTALRERSEIVDPKETAWLAQYEAAIKLFRQRAFADALQLFEKCLAAQPDDYLCAMYIEECAELLIHPPEEQWNGTFVMTEK
jgi:adenylate cyclase